MGYLSAVRDFRRARNQARREQLLAQLGGKSADLLPYEDVRDMLKAKSRSDQGLKEIPLDAIVGSVGRYADFTRRFLPRKDADQERWARVQTRFTDLEGLPPIEVYQIGEAYFVRDGNHRVSVARQLGASHIQAYVTEVQTRVSLSPDDQPDDLIRKAEYASFLDWSQLDELRPDADVTLTAPGQYQALREHIEVHRHYLGLEKEHAVPLEEAVQNWYDTVYLPVVGAIRKLGVLQEFEGRTETDLYLWVSEYRAELEAELGWQIETEAAAVDLAEHLSPRPQRRLTRLVDRLVDVLTPDELEGGPAPGTWRRKRPANRRDDCMFADILVPISGEPTSWPAVAQAVEIACREDARLLGLHVVESSRERESQSVQAIRAEFDRQCRALDVDGQFAVDIGSVARIVCDRSRWSDLVVVGLEHPPGSRPIARLSSGLATLIRRCAVPLLAVPGTFSPLRRPLLAYDGSPKSKEALYVSTYFAARGRVPLVVVAVAGEPGKASAMLEEAGQYLGMRGVEASLVPESGPVADAILSTAQEHDADVILLGGYGHWPVLEVVLGSTVDEVLRASRQPVFVSR